MPIKFLLLGGGCWGFLEGGGEVPILFLWARGFLQEVGSGAGFSEGFLEGGLPKRVLRRGS